MTKLEQALAFLTRGFSVIPLWPKSKKAQHEWTEFQKRRATPAEVEAWWAETPDANIGIITGAISGIVVADVDPRHGGDIEEARRLGPSDYSVTTRAAGLHLYYIHPGKPVPNGTNRIPGVDVRGDGGYVVAPGSYVEASDGNGEYAILTEGAFGVMPDYLWPPAASQTASGDSWIATTIAQGCQPGTRNDTLAKLAGYFAGRRVPKDITESILVPWYLREKAGKEPEAHREAARTILSVYTKEGRQTVANEEPLIVDRIIGDQAKEFFLDSILPLSDFVPKFYSEKPEWLIPDWLPVATIAFLVSPPGRFKTFLTFDAAISIAAGWPFLGSVNVLKPGPVLVIQQEDSHSDMARRFHRIFASRCPVLDPETWEGEDVPSANIPPVHIVTSRGFNLEIENLRNLERAIRRIRPRAVVIDPLYSITSAEDFMMHAARDMFPLKTLRDEYGCAFLIAAHTKKGNTDTSREGLWGSQFLNAFLETGWQIRDREDGDDNQIQVLRHFKSDGIKAKVNLEFIMNDDDGYRVVISDAEDEEQHDEVLDVLRKMPKGGAVSSEHLAAKTGLPVRKVQRRLAKFKKEGTVVSIGGLWGIPEDKTADLTAGAPANG